MTIDRIEIRNESPTGDLAGQLLHRYYDELAARLPTGFDPGEEASAQLPEFEGPTGAFLVAYLDDQPAGCGALRRFDATTAEIKRMWIDPTWRGRGIGRQLLSDLEATGRERGYQRLCLDTSAQLTEAISMYRSFGFNEVPDYNGNVDADLWFGKEISP